MPTKQTDTVPVKLTAAAIIGKVSYAEGATIALPPETAAWLVAQGSAKLLKPAKEDIPEN